VLEALTRVGGMLAFLALAAGLAAAVLGAALALVSGKARWAAVIGRYAIAGAALYAVAIIAVALSSRETVVPLRAEKFFCDVDCDLSRSSL